MKHIIHIFGASGSGTTTLGRALSEAMGLVHMDTDDYFWLPTNPKFTTKRPIAERLALMQTDIDAAERGVVISGSLTGVFHSQGYRLTTHAYMACSHDHLKPSQQSAAAI